MFQKQEHPGQCFTSEVADSDPQITGWFCPQTDSYMRRECPELEAVSAGLFILDNGEVWATGNSESLNLASRAEDRQAIEAFLQSPDRQLWDLVRLSEEARRAARAEMAEAGWC